MKNIRLHHPFSNNMTAVSNYFIDYYMPQANGEYVKLYLCLLRQVADRDCISLESIADLFDYTEKDVRRGLQYWADQGLLDLDFDQNGDISDLVFLEARKPQALKKTAAASSKEMAVCGSAKAAAVSRAKTDAEKPDARTIPPKSELSRARMVLLQEQKDIRQLLFIAESYLGKTLSPGEITSLLYYYDTLHFGTDLIEYLLEYCISRGSKSFHYIDRVALGWAEEGISTVAQAKERQAKYSQKYYTVLNAFGIRGRGPGKSEIEMIDHWFDDLHFTSDIILEACSRTIAQTQRPNFPYANKILESWHRNGIHHLSDIQTLDKEHQTKSQASAKRGTAKAAGNKFNNFSQRDYDFEQLETLLNQ